MVFMAMMASFLDGVRHMWRNNEPPGAGPRLDTCCALCWHRRLSVRRIKDQQHGKTFCSRLLVGMGAARPPASGGNRVWTSSDPPRG
jgi:hypothetical protein